MQPQDLFIFSWVARQKAALNVGDPYDFASFRGIPLEAGLNQGEIHRVPHNDREMLMASPAERLDRGRMRALLPSSSS